VIVWGTRLDECAGDPALYAAPRQAALSLDGSRPMAGVTRNHSATRWTEDVFGFDDYHHAEGNAELLPPLVGVPYLINEAVGALDGPHTYRWTDPAAARRRLRSVCDRARRVRDDYGQAPDPRQHRQQQRAT
jgi:beta-galactosidase